MDLKRLRREKDSYLYVLVHADDFALSHSSIIESVASFEKNLRTRLLQLIRCKVPIVFLDLDFGSPELPAYLQEFAGDLDRIPNFQTGNLAEQHAALSRWLLRHPERSHYVFAGGWRDACLRATVNHVAHKKPRFRVDQTHMNGIHEAQMCIAGYRPRDITIEIDWPFVF